MEEKKELLGKELNEEELDKVAGGGADRGQRYKCDDCQHTWTGTLKGTFWCPQCKSTNYHKVTAW